MGRCQERVVIGRAWGRGEDEVMRGRDGEVEEEGGFRDEMGGGGGRGTDGVGGRGTDGVRGRGRNGERGER